MSNETLRLISARRSHRAYESTPITEEQLNAVLKVPKIVCPAFGPRLFSGLSGGTGMNGDSSIGLFYAAKKELM